MVASRMPDCPIKVNELEIRLNLFSGEIYLDAMMPGPNWEQKTIKQIYAMYLTGLITEKLG